MVYGYDQEAADAAADRLMAALNAKEAEFAGQLYSPEEAAQEGIRLAKGATKPIVLADIQDNPGAGGTSDTVGLLRALIAHKAKGAVLGMIVDPEAAAAAHEVGEGALAALRRRRQGGIRRRDAGRGEVARDAPGNRRVHWHRPDVRRRPVPGRADCALITDEDSGVSVVLACCAHPGLRPGAVPRCRRRAFAGADPRAEIDRAFPRRLSADRRDGAMRGLARRACQRPGGNAIQAFAGGCAPAPARPRPRKVREFWPC